MSNKAALIILDGLANNPSDRANAVTAANTPNLDRLVAEHKFSLLETSGEHVGLPKGQMGNSEVGHLNIGAGRVVLQELAKIDRAFENSEVTSNKTFSNFCSKVKRLHLVGLCSYGGVHSSLNHCIDLVKAAKGLGVEDVFVHAITDGRDRSPGSCLEEISDLQKSGAKIADCIGRYYAMDRDNREERTNLAYELFCNAEGESSDDLIELLQTRLGAGESDEFIKPISVNKDGLIRTEDSILFFNFRADRMRQIVSKFLGRNPVLTMTQYDETFGCEVLFPPVEIKNHLGEVLAKHKLNQFRLAETEKYPHVTYFFNGGDEKPCNGEERYVVPSPRDVATYDLKPEMSAFGVKDKFIEAMQNPSISVIICNFANCDMVGHTGSLEAAVKAVEAVDQCLGDIIKQAAADNYTLVVTADHGNADQMKDYDTNEPHTYHTKYPVWCFVLNSDGSQTKLKDSGALCDVAPTMLEILEIKQPTEMTGGSLIAL